MYSGKKTKVHIQFPNNMCGVFLGRFGKEISFRKGDEDCSGRISEKLLSKNWLVLRDSCLLRLELYIHYIELQGAVDTEKIWIYCPFLSWYF